MNTSKIKECQESLAKIEANKKYDELIDTIGTSKGLNNPHVLTMVEDSQGRLICGTDGDGIYVIDSFTCTGGQRLLVEKAVKMRDEGYDGKTIADTLNEVKKRTEIYTAMDTLEYLYKNGRIANTAYYIAQLGHIKPIMHCSYGGEG